MGHQCFNRMVDRAKRYGGSEVPDILPVRLDVQTFMRMESISLKAHSDGLELI